MAEPVYITISRTHTKHEKHQHHKLFEHRDHGNLAVEHLKLSNGPKNAETTRAMSPKNQVTARPRLKWKGSTKQGKEVSVRLNDFSMVSYGCTGASQKPRLLTKSPASEVALFGGGSGGSPSSLAARLLNPNM